MPAVGRRTHGAAEHVDGIHDGDRSRLLQLAKMSSGNADYVGEAFAERGSVVANIRYRLHTPDDGTTAFDSVKDAKSAVRYVRSHAKVLGIDPDKIVAGGRSAGGHLAASLGVHYGMDALNVGDDLDAMADHLLPLPLPMVDDLVDAGALTAASLRSMLLEGPNGPYLQARLAPGALTIEDTYHLGFLAEYARRLYVLGDIARLTQFPPGDPFGDHYGTLLRLRLPSRPLP